MQPDTKNPVYIDFETYYGDDYSLRSMHTSAYVRDPRFKVHGVGVAVGNNQPVWFTGVAVDQFFAAVDWSEVDVVGHNLLFDGLIMTHRYGAYPRSWIDTLGMSRAIIGGRLKSMGLDSVGNALGLGGKLNHGKALGDVKNVVDLTPEQEAKLGSYCIDDVKLTRSVYHTLRQGFPAGEYEPMSWTIEMGVNPKVQIDTGPLEELAKEEKDTKRELVKQTGLKQTQISSNAQFADVLRAAGVEPPTKVSATTGRETFAFSKKDEAFIDLLEHPDDKVVDLVEARLAVKSTIKESRAKAMIGLADQGPWALQLNYSGAVQTHRLCLVGDTSIVVLRNGQIEQIRLDELQAPDKLWDGIEFVDHEGLVYAGDKEVIEWDDITGTKDHRVLIARPGEQRRFVGLAAAAQEGDNICVAQAPEGTRFTKGVLWGCDEAVFYSSALLEVWRGEEHALSGYRQIGKGLVQELRSAGAYAGTGDEPQGSGCSERSQQKSILSPTQRSYAGTVETPDDVGQERVEALQQPEQQGLSKLRRAWHKVLLQLAARRSALGLGQSGSASRQNHVGRPYRQQQALRTGQPALGGSVHTSTEQTPGVRVEPTFDIVNCGPRNRFVANGKIVHNSGGGGVNPQNLPRNMPDKPSLLRQALCAAEGRKLVAIDLSQIELRVNCAVSGQHDVLQRLVAGEDEYAHFASVIYDRPITKADKLERNVGKVGVLSLGYGSGAATFRTMLRGYGIRLSLAECQKIVKAYRATYPHIKASWRIYEGWLRAMLWGEVPVMEPQITAPITLKSDGFVLPSGLHVSYPQLQRYDWQYRKRVNTHDDNYADGLPNEDGYMQAAREDTGYAYQNMRKPIGVASVYGSKTCGNICQSLARDVNIHYVKQLRQQLASVDPTASVVMSVHDESVIECAAEHADAVLALGLQIMNTPPDWWPNLPVAAEGSIGQNYAEAK